MSRPGGVTVVDLDRRAPERMDERDGWLISAFRTAFGDETGTDSLLFRATFRTGARHERHRHTRVPEISVCLSGEPIAGTDQDVRRIGPGTFRWIDRGVSHFLAADDDRTAVTEIVGLYVGAGSVAASGYVHEGGVGSRMVAYRTDRAPYPCIALTELPPTDSGRLAWTAAAVRIPLGAHEGCGAVVVVVDTATGARQAEVSYDGSDAILYVTDGAFELNHALQAAPLRAGSAAHVARGTRHAVRARSNRGRIIMFLPHAADLRSAELRGS